MASDDITSAGHVTLETSLVDEHLEPKSPQAVTHKHSVSYDAALEDLPLEEVAPVQALDGEDLPWIGIAKWRKGLVMTGYVSAPNIYQLYLTARQSFLGTLPIYSGYVHYRYCVGYHCVRAR